MRETTHRSTKNNFYFVLINFLQVGLVFHLELGPALTTIFDRGDSRIIFSNSLNIR